MLWEDMLEHVNLESLPEHSPPADYSPQEEYRHIVESYLYEPQDAAPDPNVFQEDFGGVTMQSPTTIDDTQRHTQTQHNAATLTQRTIPISGLGTQVVVSYQLQPMKTICR
ncbi:hypothetical protein BDZ45DRAFT_751247 [Acephala macrosclerotiorum]|nr:hypothetical protein BDZ45DRAFT_751247 [Acephala macrosclerotiorum]